MKEHLKNKLFGGFGDVPLPHTYEKKSCFKAAVIVIAFPPGYMIVADD
jgi:hypothetical protein